MPLFFPSCHSKACKVCGKADKKTTSRTAAAIVFFIKLGVAIGGALAGWLLAYYGYQGDIEQSMTTQQGILTSFTLFPAIGSILVAWVMRWYILDAEKVELIHQELQQTSL